MHTWVIHRNLHHLQLAGFSVFGARVVVSELPITVIGWNQKSVRRGIYTASYSLDSLVGMILGHHHHCLLSMWFRVAGGAQVANVCCGWRSAFAHLLRTHHVVWGHAGSSGVTILRSLFNVTSFWTVAPLSACDAFLGTFLLITQILREQPDWLVKQPKDPTSGRKSCSIPATKYMLWRSVHLRTSQINAPCEVNMMRSMIVDAGCLINPYYVMRWENI